ncbi:MAG: hypothetical protein HY599_05525 [Candidatus Omnitrophica bacterium]|nr:hypothetical protein [Candidatus Omnitrophota bacterium]
MNRLDNNRQKQILTALVEGASLRATSRMVGVSINTVTKLLVDAGRACTEYQDQALRNLPCKHIQCDEIWSFCYAKEKNVPKDKRGKFGYGNVWTWTAICADTKLVPSWLVAERNLTAATAFIQDLASRLKHRVQITTDGHTPYLEAIEVAYSGTVLFSGITVIHSVIPVMVCFDITVISCSITGIIAN